MGEASEIVIVGGGQAACELATNLRQRDFAGGVTIIGEEHYPPYQRPPLSKGYLSETEKRAALFVKPEEKYAQANVKLVKGIRITEIDRRGKRVIGDNHSDWKYEKLVLATGGRARRLPERIVSDATAIENLHYLRTIDDTDRIRGNLKSQKNIVIIGGGYIGLEVAAAAIKAGATVTTIESAPRILARVTSPLVSDYYEKTHKSHGVRIVVDVQVEKFSYNQDGTRIECVHCKDGEVYEADLVIAGVGLEPNQEIAAAAGLEVSNGIDVDFDGRTSDNDVFAIGDCANVPSELYDRRIRLESVPAALEQARMVGAVLTNDEKQPPQTPWFWSDQYDLKLQMAGLSSGFDECVLRGDNEQSAFSAFYLKGNRIIAADCVNNVREFMAAKKLIAAKAVASVQDLSDPGVDLKTLLTNH